MNEFRNWCRLIDVVVICGGLINFFVPENRLKSAYRTLYSVLLIAVLALPLADGVTLDFGDAAQTSSSIEEADLADYSNSLIGSISSREVEGCINGFIRENISDDVCCKAEVRIENEQISSVDIEIYGSLTQSEKQLISDYILAGIGGDVRIEYSRAD